MTKVAHIEVVFDTYDFWSGPGWHEDNSIDRIDTDASERKYRRLVMKELSEQFGCSWEYTTKESGTGDEVYVTTDDDSNFEGAVNEALFEIAAARFEDYESWVVEN